MPRATQLIAASGWRADRGAEQLLRLGKPPRWAGVHPSVVPNRRSFCWAGMTPWPPWQWLLERASRIEQGTAEVCVAQVACPGRRAAAQIGATQGAAPQRLVETQTATAEPGAIQGAPAEYWRALQLGAASSRSRRSALGTRSASAKGQLAPNCLLSSRAGSGPRHRRPCATVPATPAQARQGPVGGNQGQAKAGSRP